MKTEKHPCGCKSERGTGRERWVELCDPCKAEASATHQRWAAERQSLAASTLAVSPL